MGLGVGCCESASANQRSVLGGGRTGDEGRTQGRETIIQRGCVGVLQTPVDEVRIMLERSC
jgi:hypothetical protein